MTAGRGMLRASNGTRMLDDQDVCDGYRARRDYGHMV